MWELPNEEEKIMSVLKLSFDNLKSPFLKQCFAYCSMFRKDFEIERDNLVQLWMAQGYLHSSPNMTMEDIGNEYFNILLQNSLFQDAIEDEYGVITKCKMHDLVHDLVEEVFKSESLMWDSDQMDDALEIQHVARISSMTLERIPQGSVRRLRPLFVDWEVPRNIFQRFRALRTLNLSGVVIVDLSSSIGKLKHLRYLNISNTGIKKLPKSIGKLYNLQTLIMSGTWKHTTFPRKMENLINLRHVYFDEDEEVSFGMTRLTHLQTLPSFNLDRARRHRLDELGGLNELKGQLVIGALEYVRDKEEAMKSNLVGKANLQKLKLKWGRDHSANLHEDILEGLQPHHNLKSLMIENFMGTKFASWMTSDLLPINLTEIILYMCEECEAVPPLGHLPNLRSVLIDHCTNLKSLPISQSQSIEKLKLRDCPKLRYTSIQNLLSLRDLVIWGCPTLEGDLSLNDCTSLMELRIIYCNGLTSILSGLHSCTSLRTLCIQYCRNLRTFSGHGLQTPVSLEVLIISDCPYLEAIPSLHNLTSLLHLYIGCDRLTSIPSGLASCTSLAHLSVVDCHNLISLADHNLSSLQSLSSLLVSNCGKLQYLPKGLHSLSCLERLWIGNFCKELDSFPDFQVPSKLEELTLSGWPKLKSLPHPIQHSTSLTSLSISYFDGVEALPEWLGNLTSLTQLRIHECKNVMYLPTVEAMQRLTKLHKLYIFSCPRLEERCAKDSGPEWPKIDHIPVISDTLLYRVVFHLTVCSDNGTRVLTSVMGTAGYLDPDFTGQPATIESDDLVHIVGDNGTPVVTSVMGRAGYLDREFKQVQEHCCSNTWIITFNNGPPLSYSALTGLEAEKNKKTRTIYLHKGAIHVSNILLSENLDAKIADFGLSMTFPSGSETRGGIGHGNSSVS
ncbi:unnamed protein product [Malus baccata var. baccata]